MSERIIGKSSGSMVTRVSVLSNAKVERTFSSISPLFKAMDSVACRKARRLSSMLNKAQGSPGYQRHYRLVDKKRA